MPEKIIEFTPGIENSNLLERFPEICTDPQTITVFEDSLTSTFLENVKKGINSKLPLETYKNRINVIIKNTKETALYAKDMATSTGSSLSSYAIESMNDGVSYATDLASSTSSSVYNVVVEGTNDLGSSLYLRMEETKTNDGNGGT